MRQQYLCKRLGIRHPVIQAPMAGGACTPELVAAVGRAGALGSFGFAYTSPDAIAADIDTLRSLADVPFNANLFVFPPAPAQIDGDAALGVLAGCGLYAEFDQEPPATVPAGPCHPDLDAQIEVLCKLRPPVVTFHFGLPGAADLDRLKAGGSVIGASATTATDAMTLEAAGVDFVIAQGAEAGGHRSSFSPDASDHPIGTFALVRAISDRLTIPVVAAGGIMDGRDIAAAEVLGAAAVQLGTAFLSTDESGQADLYREVLAGHCDRQTVLTRGFSGRWARGLENRFTEEMAGQPVLPFPVQNAATASLRSAARKAGSIEAQSVWAGQGFARMRSISVEDLVRSLTEERAAAHSSAG